MEDNNTNKKLFDEFAPVSTETWEEKIKVDLKGADYDKKLVWKTIDGIKVQPYYRSEHLKGKEYQDINPSEFPYVRGNKTKDNSWEIRQDFLVKDPVTSNQKILNALKKGATSVGVKVCKRDIDSKEKFLTIFKGVDLANIPLHIRGGKGTPLFVQYLSEELSEKNITDKAKGTFSFDTLGHLTYKGGFYTEETKDFESLTEAVKAAKKGLPGFKIVGVNGTNFGNAGSSLVQELAFSLSMANEYMAQLTYRGVSVDDAAKSINFTLSIGTNYFMEIAKVRAARLLWANIVKEYKPENIDSAVMYVHAETQLFNKTSYDPYVNMLRTTTEAMSAAIGGVDSITIKPFNQTFEEETVVSERIARNTQVILKEEAYFDKIIDPSAGSYYIENLTDSIAEEAWSLFKEIESEGGYLEAFKKEIIQKKVGEIVDKRKDFIATRREILVGSNQFPNFNELVNSKVVSEIAFEENGACSTIVASPLKRFRGAEEFEKLRLRTENHGHRPKVFMLTIGNLTMRKARASFSCNFFACAGYEVIDNLGFNSVEEGVEAAIKAKADIVVVCSSDDEYVELVPSVNAKLPKGMSLVVAGAPACMEDLKSQGIEHFIHVRSNVLATLNSFHSLIGIK